MNKVTLNGIGGVSGPLSTPAPSPAGGLSTTPTKPATPAIPKPVGMPQLTPATPPAQQLPKPAAPAKPADGMNWLTPAGAMGALGNALKSNQYDVTSALTQAKPPLANATGGLPPAFQGPVNSALGMVQKGLQQPGGDQMFAGILGAAAPGLTGGLLSTPIGLPALTAMHGMLRGGESFAAANTYLKPLLGDLTGLSGK